MKWERISLAILFCMMLSMMSPAPICAQGNPELKWIPAHGASNPVSAFETSAPVGEWYLTGPWGGCSPSLAIDPANNSTIYAGTNDGMYKTDNGSGSWINIGLENCDIRGVAIDPVNTSAIYAGRSAMGVYKSTNGGASWTNTGLAGRYILSLAIDPANTPMIYAGTFGARSVWRMDLSPVTLSCAPDAPIVKRGAKLGYTVTATNNCGTTKTFKYWTNVTLPNGSPYPPSGALFGPVTVSLSAHHSRSVHLTQTIPAAAPLGNYSYNCYAGLSATNIWDECSFGLQVTP